MSKYYDRSPYSEKGVTLKEVLDEGDDEGVFLTRVGDNRLKFNMGEGARRKLPRISQE